MYQAFQAKHADAISGSMRSRRRGHFKPNAQPNLQGLQNDFVVEGEQHYWAHVAIDRFRGQVIDTQIEVVTE